MRTHESLRDRLRAAKVVGVQPATFDTDAAPTAPLPLLVEWLESALDAGVSQPQAASLATATSDGIVSNRTLLLKDVDDTGVWFASLSTAPKGRDLAGNPRAAMLLYWREQGRQVRISGSVEPGPRDVSDADFLTRHPNARAMAIAGRQSEPLPGDDAPSTLDELLDAAHSRIAADPHFVPDAWTAYRLVPVEVEFWQADRARDQIRLRYRRSGDAWERELLWP
jgi:pyridoxamine 5'-phosphate oxidase